MGKKKRQEVIRQIIQSQEIERQDELLVALQEKGIEATQATISRDMREIGVIKKMNGLGILAYTVAPQGILGSENHPLIELFEDSVVKMTRIQFINIINTSLGTADVVAAGIDALALPEIVGTLAGTDTIVLFSTSEETAEKIYQELSHYVQS